MDKKYNPSLFETEIYKNWLEKGYFKEEGLNIEVVLTPGADKVAASVLSNEAHIGFSGPEATIYIYNNSKEIDHYNVYKMRMLVRHDADGKLYLYDFLHTKKEKETSSPL